MREFSLFDFIKFMEKNSDKEYVIDVDNIPLTTKYAISDYRDEFFSKYSEDSERWNGEAGYSDKRYYLTISDYEQYLELEKENKEKAEEFYKNHCESIFINDNTDFKAVVDNIYLEDIVVKYVKDFDGMGSDGVEILSGDYVGYYIFYDDDCESCKYLDDCITVIRSHINDLQDLLYKISEELSDVYFTTEDVDSLNDDNRIYIYNDYLGKVSLELNSSEDSDKQSYKIVFDLHSGNYSYNGQEIFDNLNKFKKILEEYSHDLVEGIFDDVRDILKNIYKYMN